MLIRIKNAARAKKELVTVSYSAFCYEILKALERAGYVAVAERKGKRARRFLEIKVLGKDGEALLRDIKILSRPSRRVYAGWRDVARAPHGGIMLMSTPKGVMAHREARKAKVGGMLIAEIW